VKIQLNTDSHIGGTEHSATRVSATLEQTLARFGEHVTRIEVHLSDVNSSNSSQQDLRCMLEARLEGRQPVAVVAHAMTSDQAVDAAAKKLVHLLDSTLGRLHDHRKNASDRSSLDTDST
jgi:ribosome-associated translation inhibitor RaiA